MQRQRLPVFVAEQAAWVPYSANRRAFAFQTRPRKKKWQGHEVMGDEERGLRSEVIRLAENRGSLLTENQPGSLKAG